MSFSLPSILGGATAAFVAGFVWLVTPERPFMVVHDIRIADGQVYADRTIRYPARVADWRVTIVGAGVDAPSCATVPGPGLHQGWSVYEPNERDQQSMSLDVWVGDPGCYDRLPEGDHLMLVNWTPRDGGPPVSYKMTFTIQSREQEGE